MPNDPKKTKQLTLNLCLAEGQRTELVMNIRTEDEMTNGNVFQTKMRFSKLESNMGFSDNHLSIPRTLFCVQ